MRAVAHRELFGSDDEGGGRAKAVRGLSSIHGSTLIDDTGG